MTMGKMGKKERARIKRAPEELRDQLREQYGFLQRSAAAYDSGFEGEAMRLATTLRVLLYDGGSSRSLLRQLQVKDRLRFQDTALYPSPYLVQKAGLVIIQITTGVEARHVTPLDMLTPSRIHRPLPFKPWWTLKVIEGSQGRTYSRGDLVLTMANQDGGAHVDPDLDADYAALRHDSLGVTHISEPADPVESGALNDSVAFGLALQAGPDGSRPDASENLRTGTPAQGNVAGASIRQIAHEVLKTLGDQLRSLL